MRQIKRCHGLCLQGKISLFKHSNWVSVKKYPLECKRKTSRSFYRVHTQFVWYKQWRNSEQITSHHSEIELRLNDDKRLFYIWRLQMLLVSRHLLFCILSTQFLYPSYCCPQSLSLLLWSPSVPTSTRISIMIVISVLLCEYGFSIAIVRVCSPFQYMSHLIILKRFVSTDINMV